MSDVLDIKKKQKRIGKLPIKLFKQSLAKNGKKEQKLATYDTFSVGWIKVFIRNGLINLTSCQL